MRGYRRRAAAACLGVLMAISSAFPAGAVSTTGREPAGTAKEETEAAKETREEGTEKTSVKPKSPLEEILGGGTGDSEPEGKETGTQPEGAEAKAEPEGKETGTQPEGVEAKAEPEQAKGEGQTGAADRTETGEKETDQNGGSKERTNAGDLAEFVPLESLQVITSEQAAEINAQMSTYVPTEGSLVRNHAEHYYYYEHLAPEAREMYDIMLGIAKDPVPENHGVMLTDLDPQSGEFEYFFVMAYFSLVFDHPELFWLYNTLETTIGTRSECLSAGGFYVVYFGLTDPYTNYREQMTAFNEAADAMLARVNREASDYEIALQIHDLLMETVTYDTDVLNRHEGQDFAHTAYGALVENSSGVKNFAVCDGYSLAYEYLLQQCGIEAAVVNGDAGPSREEAGGHAWNLIRLEGEWYEADCTWDDPDSDFEDLLASLEQEEAIEWLENLLADEAFMETVEHYLFLISTEEMNHFIPGEEFYVNFYGNSFPFLDECYHFRYETDGTINPDQGYYAVISLAPEAPKRFQKEVQ